MHPNSKTERFASVSRRGPKSLHLCAIEITIMRRTCFENSRKEGRHAPTATHTSLRLSSHAFLPRRSVFLQYSRSCTGFAAQSDECINLKHTIEQLEDDVVLYNHLPFTFYVQGACDAVPGVMIAVNISNFKSAFWIVHVPFSATRTCKKWQDVQP